MNGIFKIITNKPRLNDVTWLSIIEIPITPPSIMSFGARNEESPNPVTIAPNVIKNKLFIFLKYLINLLLILKYRHIF